MKKHDKILIVLGTFSLVFVLIFEVIARDCTEWFAGAGELVSVLVNIFLSCLAGCIIYFISCYLPLREIERKRHEEQVKVDEIVAVHLRNVLDSISRIFIVAYGDWAKFESIVLNPLDEVEFKSIAKNIKPTDIAAISRSKFDPNTGVGYPMTVEDFIFESIENILGEHQKLFQLERFLSVDLIKTLSRTEQTQIISNWDTLMNDKPTVIGGQKYYYPKGDLANYSSAFKSLDESFRSFQSEILLLAHTEAGKQYSKAFK